MWYESYGGYYENYETYKNYDDYTSRTHAVLSGPKWEIDNSGRRELTYSYSSPNYWDKTNGYGFTYLTSFTDEQVSITESVLQEVANDERIKLTFKRVGPHEKSMLSFASYGSDSGAVAGHANFPNEYFGSKIWVKTTSDREVFKNVVSHELGHALGLDHSDPNAKNTVMTPHTMRGVGFQERDLQNLQKIYSTGTAPRTRREDGNNAPVPETSDLTGSPREYVSLDCKKFRELSNQAQGCPEKKKICDLWNKFHAAGYQVEFSSLSDSEIALIAPLIPARNADRPTELGFWDGLLDDGFSDLYDTIANGGNKTVEIFDLTIDNSSPFVFQEGNMLHNAIVQFPYANNSWVTQPDYPSWCAKTNSCFSAAPITTYYWA